MRNPPVEGARPNNPPAEFFERRPSGQPLPCPRMSAARSHCRRCPMGGPASARDRHGGGNGGVFPSPRPRGAGIGRSLRSKSTGSPALAVGCGGFGLGIRNSSWRYFRPIWLPEPGHAHGAHQEASPPARSPPCLYFDELARHIGPARDQKRKKAFGDSRHFGAQPGR